MLPACVTLLLRTLEIRGADEIDELVRAELHSGSGGSGADATHGLDNIGGSSAANISHSKPARPGKGKAKVSKFVVDEN